MKRFNDLVASAAQHAMTEPELDAWLTQHKVSDPTERIAVKVRLAHMQASGELSTDQDHGASLATDSPVSYAPKGPPVSREMARWLSTAGLDLANTYTLAQVDQALSGAGFDTLTRMAIKAEMFDRKRIDAGAESTPTPRPTTITAKRTMQASTPRRILRDANTGEPVTLKFLP